MSPRVLILASALAAIPAAAQPTAPFDYEAVQARAQQLAAAPYQVRTSPVPDWLKRLSYDQYREIRFIPVQSWWNHEALPFKLQFFHPGFLFRRTVQIGEVVDGQAQLIPFSPKLFTYGRNSVGPLPEDMGYAGFRIHNFLNQPGDELGVFQGASYFRFLCRRSVYGLSARGLAVDTAEPGGEEFPSFEQFWVVKPTADASEIVVYGLLDSPRVAGAYRFAIRPGSDTVMDVRATVYCRSNPKVLGFAPLTSMFWHGTTSNFETDDVRPQVHDSDGLMLNTGTGEWLWRPLTNPATMRSMSFMDAQPRGFGLIQRDRRFDSYRDIEAAYHRRPSAWVETIGDWGRGCVRLVELHSPDETNDNIVAFWVPAELPPPGTPIELHYRLHWFLDQIRPPAGYVLESRHGRSRTFETDLERFVIDFDGSELRKAAADTPIKPVVWVGQGATLVNTIVQKDPYDDTWRVAFALRPDGSKGQVELRCHLVRGTDVVSETWSYLWEP